MPKMILTSKRRVKLPFTGRITQHMHTHTHTHNKVAQHEILGNSNFVYSLKLLELLNIFFNVSNIISRSFLNWCSELIFIYVSTCIVMMITSTFFYDFLYMSLPNLCINHLIKLQIRTKASFLVSIQMGDLSRLKGTQSNTLCSGSG